MSEIMFHRVDHHQIGDKYPLTVYHRCNYSWNPKKEFEYLKSNQDIYQDTNEDYREIRDNEEELEFRKLAHDHIKIIASEENSFKARLNFEKETFEEIKKPELPVIEKDFEVEKNELGGVVLPSKELPWEEIKAKVEEKRAELTFEKTAR
jgi:hypothetical protein